MKTTDIALIARTIVPIVREYVSRSLNPFGDRLLALEQRTVRDGKDGESGHPGERGENGPTGDRGEMGVPGQKGDVGEIGPQGERGEDGQPGRDGKDADESRVQSLERDLESIRAELLFVRSTPTVHPDVEALIRAAVASEVALIPRPKDGEPGKSVELSDVEPLVKAAVDAIPRPQDGRSVTADDVAPMIASEVTKAVAALPQPKEPVSIAGAFIDRAGELTITFTDGQTKSVGVVVGRDGSDHDPEAMRRHIEGELAKWPKPLDGKDGLGFDDFTVEYDGERTVTLTFQHGDRVKAFPLKMPVTLYRGLYEAGKAYETGDEVTWGGSMWIAKHDVAGVAPDENSPAGKKAWALSTMRGRQGKQGLKGDVGDRGPRGEMGPQGRQGF